MSYTRHLLINKKEGKNGEVNIGLDLYMGVVNWYHIMLYLLLNKINNKWKIILWMKFLVKKQ